MSEPIVLQLQAECLDAGEAISPLLRKARLIASKLGLSDTGDWLEQELNGYTGSLRDLPSYRIGIGMPKFFNPFHGWMDIVITDAASSKRVSTCYLPQAIGELEHLALHSDSAFVILGFPDPINDYLYGTCNIRFNCGLHLSKGVLVGALEGIRNSVLEWALALERQGVVGEGLSFSRADIEKAQTVTNHFHNSNVGVVGQVAGNAFNSRFTTESGALDQAKLEDLAKQIRVAVPGLPVSSQRPVIDQVTELERASAVGDKSALRTAVASLRSVLEGTSGSLVAAGILAALGAS